MNENKKSDPDKVARERQRIEEQVASTESRPTREDLESANFTKLMPGSTEQGDSSQEEHGSDHTGLPSDAQTDLTNQYEVGESSDIDTGMFGREGMKDYISEELGETTQRFRDAGAFDAGRRFDPSEALDGGFGHSQGGDAAGVGKGGISDGVVGGAGYPAGTYKDQGGLRGTNYKPGDSPLENFGKDLSRPFVPGGGLGERDKQIRDLNRGDATVKEIKNEDGTTTTVTKYDDGTVAVQRGNTTITKHPDGTLTETTTDPKTGETTKTETYKPQDPGPEGLGPDGQPAPVPLPPGFIDGDDLLPPGMRAEDILQGTTGIGQKGGETVNPSRTDEGAGGETPLGEPTGFLGKTAAEHLGQPAGPGIDDPLTGGGSSPDPTLGPGRDVIDPGDEGNLPPGEARTDEVSGVQTGPRDTASELSEAANISGDASEWDFTEAAEQIHGELEPPIGPIAPPPDAGSTDPTSVGGREIEYPRFELPPWEEPDHYSGGSIFDPASPNYQPPLEDVTEATIDPALDPNMVPPPTQDDAIDSGWT